MPELVEALESYSSHLEPSFVKIPLPPTSSTSSIPIAFDLSPNYVTALDNEFTRVYEEYTRRVASVKALAEEIVKLWAELGTPQAQTDGAIVKNYRDSPEQLGLHEDDLVRLRNRKERLMEEKRGRERRLKELKAAVEGLWDRLGVDAQERKRFIAGTRGCGMRAINEFEDELARLDELKRQNLHLFVEDARYRLQELWDQLYFSEEEMLEFTPAFSDVCSDALLSAHEAEISRLEALKEQRAPTLQLIEKHRSLINDRDELAASSQDASRLMARGTKGEKRDPTRLLREEKMRKRIAKDLPKIESDLKNILESWEDEYGRPFLVHGERYLEELAASTAKPAPPRSKTPSCPPPATKINKPAPSSQRGGNTLRGPPPPRSGAESSMSTMRRNPLASSIASTAGARTPSRIPARVPLGNMPHGNNSPERRGPPEPVYNPSALRKMGPPTRAPPPKMRDLFVPPPAPTPIQDYSSNSPRCVSVASSTGSVRQITPEDVYDDRPQTSYMNSSSAPTERNTPQTYRDLQRSAHLEQGYRQQGQYDSVASSRQISATSTTNNTVSGSENWETYDDASEPEPDASEAYYAKLKATRGKRFTPDGGYALPHAGPTKKLRGIRGVGGAEGTLVEGKTGRLMPAGSDASWTDEDAF